MPRRSVTGVCQHWELSSYLPSSKVISLEAVGRVSCGEKGAGGQGGLEGEKMFSGGMAPSERRLEAGAGESCGGSKGLMWREQFLGTAGLQRFRGVSGLMSGRGEGRGPLSIEDRPLFAEKGEGGMSQSRGSLCVNVSV